MSVRKFSWSHQISISPTMAVHIKNAEIEIFALAIKIISPGVRGHHVFSRHNVNS